jgi:hypothetical protein
MQQQHLNLRIDMLSTECAHQQPWQHARLSSIPKSISHLHLVSPLVMG